MKKKGITIGELAKLMDVSIHQIRYFEEKEILFPSYIDKNGYRMYGIEEIYTLAHILLLRRFNISVSDIKKQIDTFSKEDYIDVLEKSVRNVEKRIKELEALKNITNDIINKAKTHQRYENSFTIKSLPERRLSFLTTIDHNSFYSARDLYDELYKSKRIGSIYSSNFITLIDEENLHVYIEMNNSRDYILEKGKYLSYQFLIKNNSEMHTKIDNFFTYAEKNKIELTGYLIEIEDPDLCMFYNEELYVELQMLIR
ncbi:MerR family transcriptional regulator [Wukongibacter sp. M2B1]|uniref:helix-turn-helix domain-containing protein n=1 Tax=Wukongibacter sp. M2B1 TaxID=3088895 RepID=UPI003D7AEFB6